jgi:hypothetical protein
VAASTITRDTLTNDTGTASTPAGDGTVLDNDFFQDFIYARIDEMFAGAGAYATLTVGGKIAAEGFGSHTIAAGGTGTQTLLVRNTSAGTTNLAGITIGNDASASAGLLLHASSNFTTGGDAIQDALLIRGARAGGVTISASDAAGTIKFYATSLTNFAGALTYASSGGVLRMVSSGNATAPTYSFDGDTDTGIYRTGANQLGFVAGATYQARLDGPFSSFGAAAFVMVDAGFGTGNVTGPGVYIGRNSSGAGAAGWLGMSNLGGTPAYMWIDNSGSPPSTTAALLRISTAPPQEDGSPSDTSGIVVGTQTSSLDTKDVLGPGVPMHEALQTILDTKVVRFRYKGGAYSGSVFHGIVSDWSPAFAMDPDAAHPNGRSFNPISAFGYTVQAIKALKDHDEAIVASLQTLETRIAALEERAA